MTVDPFRVRQARLEAGLSLADIARGEVSRTFIHFVEHGKSRPSAEVLNLIAQRTGKPVSYFLREPIADGRDKDDLANALMRLAQSVRRIATSQGLTQSDQEAMLLLQCALRHGAQLTRAIQTRNGQGMMSSGGRR